MPIIKVKREDILSPDEVEQFIQKSKTKKNKCLIALLYLLGARVSEVLMMKRKHIAYNKDEDLLYFDMGILKRRKSVIPFRHKIPINAHARFIPYIIEYINEIKDSERLLFRSPIKEEDVPMHRSTAWKIVSNASAINVDGESKPRAWCHLFRHTRATELKEAGAGALEMMVWMGWKDTRPAVKYVHRSIKMIKKLGMEMK
jgi:integrase